jgi:hypothetical protein
MAFSQVFLDWEEATEAKGEAKGYCDRPTRAGTIARHPSISATNRYFAYGTSMNSGRS